MLNVVHDLIGRDADSIVWWQMVIRAAIIFFYLIFLIRIGGMRAFGKSTAFDIVLGVLLGSALSRTLTGNASFFPTLAATASLVLLHTLIAKASLHSTRLGHLVKGVEIKLVENGKMLTAAMRMASVTEHDLRESLRSNAKTDDLSEIREAYLERSGKISFLM